ncbi:MAG TPA: hypothetical protein VK633_04485, partial [Verrucomicrobiae bacterium]|nr:hypothetical protein [Verrucomicrobiae bacterium]
PGMTYPIGQSANANPNGSTMTTPSAIRQIPSRRIRAGVDNSGMNYAPGTPSPLPGAAAQPQGETLDPAEQYVRMHLNRAAAEKQGMAQPPLPMVGQ